MNRLSGRAAELSVSAPPPRNITAVRAARESSAVDAVLFIGSSDAIRHDVEWASAKLSISTATVSGTIEALAWLEPRRDVVCVLELSADGSSTRTVQAIRSKRPGTIVIGIGEANASDATTEALRAGLFDVIGLPIERTELLALLTNATEQVALAQAAPEQQPIEVGSYGVFGTSAAMRDVMRLVERAAPSRCGVTVCGERGTGREMVARAIHAHGLHPDAPFVRMDCAAPAPQELEHDLFGFAAGRRGEKAKRRQLEQIGKSGRFYEAIGGTLFLENVLDMPDRAQARLVRLLRDREAIVEGESEPIEADVRAIVAMEPSVDSAVEDGRLREDLYERLTVIRIDLPALRHRREDVPMLAIHFLKEICRDNSSATKTMSRAALTLLTALPWRGNARELRMLLERLVLLVPNGVIRMEDVLAHVRLDGSLPSLRGDATLREARAHFEREYIRAALQHHHGRMGETARSLGIQRTNLYRKVRSLNLSVPGMDRGGRR